MVRELPAGPLIGRRALFRQDLSEGPQRPGPGSAIMPGGGVGHGSGSLRPQWPLLGRSCPVATRERTRARVGRQGVGEQVTGWVAWAWAFSGTGVGRTGGGGRLHPSPAPRPRCRSEASTPASRQPGSQAGAAAEVWDPGSVWAAGSPGRASVHTVAQERGERAPQRRGLWGDAVVSGRGAAVAGPWAAGTCPRRGPDDGGGPAWGRVLCPRRGPDDGGGGPAWGRQAAWRLKQIWPGSGWPHGK